MTVRTLLAACPLAIALLAPTGCAMTDTAESNGVQIEDISITNRVKNRFLDNARVDGRAIKVEARNGTILLTGVASSYAEKSSASEIALGVQGVRVVQNEITVRQ